MYPRGDRKIFTFCSFPEGFGLPKPSHKRISADVNKITEEKYIEPLWRHTLNAGVTVHFLCAEIISTVYGYKHGSESIFCNMQIMIFELGFFRSIQYFFEGNNLFFLFYIGFILVLYTFFWKILLFDKYIQ